ncbi:hypothetical protein IJ818_01915 [bacterium]|nr:hypothetical protein [bacterium]
MPEYLTKEEIKQWRSSLEKITLEEFAKRLGKEIEETKHTNDLVDIVMKGQTGTSVTTSRIDRSSTIERISASAQRAAQRETEIAPSVYKPKNEQKAEVKVEKVVEAAKEAVKKEVEKISAKTSSKQSVSTSNKSSSSSISSSNTLSASNNVNNSGFEFKKPLTEREQMVFNYFLSNKDTVVFAKDLAKLLNLPRDYVYKYIKTLRAKIEGDNLRNAESGGFILSDK